MQSNLLSNYCLFFATLESQDCFKILSQLNTMPVSVLPSKSIEFRLLESRKEIKNPLMKPKEKPSRVVEYEVAVVRDQQVSFLFSQEKSPSREGKEYKDGTVAMVSSSCEQLSLFSKIFGEMSLKASVKCVLEVVSWENYLIFHGELSDKKRVLFVQEIYSSTTLTCANEEDSLTKKLRLMFEPFLELLMGTERMQTEMASYLKELLRIRTYHPEIVKEIDREKTYEELNFSLVLFYFLAAAFKTTL